ncbi:MAG: hypothetical protein WAW36_10390, partial [Methylovulum miyakonense]|uniref:hypothetical protein n=1 Tax=Methylovulum miyakonense TaxID=645578 RepID=UPI003BB7753D
LSNIVSSSFMEIFFQGVESQKLPFSSDFKISSFFLKTVRSVVMQKANKLPASDISHVYKQ